MNRQVFLGLVLFFAFQAAGYNFERTLSCNKVGPKGCLHWNRTMTIFDIVEGYSGFAANTSVLSKNGHKNMSELQVGDEVFGLDPKTGKDGFSKIQAWIYRNPYANSEFIRIRTNGSLVVDASPLQNYAYIDPSGKIRYKFAVEFSPGDELVAFPSEKVRVTSVHKK